MNLLSIPGETNSMQWYKIYLYNVQYTQPFSELDNVLEIIIMGAIKSRSNMQNNLQLVRGMFVIVFVTPHNN